MSKWRQQKLVLPSSAVALRAIFFGSRFGDREGFWGRDGCADVFDCWMDGEMDGHPQSGVPSCAHRVRSAKGPPVKSTTLRGFGSRRADDAAGDLQRWLADDSEVRRSGARCDRLRAAVRARPRSFVPCPVTSPPEGRSRRDNGVLDAQGVGVEEQPEEQSPGARDQPRHHQVAERRH